MKNPEKKTTATMKTTPATMPTHIKIEFDLLRRSSYGGVSKVRLSPATAVCSVRDSRGSVMAQSSRILERTFRAFVPSRLGRMSSFSAVDSG
jgi:hypothetical protein